MQHPYLIFSASSSYEGKRVGTGTETDANALSNKSVTVVQIPPKFEGQNVVEIGQYSFYGKNIVSVFIPSIVRCLSFTAFHSCRSLKEVRFEKGSKLEKLDNLALFNSAIENIDLPQSLKTILATQEIWPQFYGSNIKCISYLGTADFSNSNIIHSSVPSVTIHTSSSYPSDTFGGRSVIKDGKTCGVSNEAFEKTPRRSRNKITCVVEKNSPNDLLLMFFLAES